MSSTQEEMESSSRSSKKSGGVRRTWTHLEEEALIKAMKELIVLGWKSDNGFRAGYLGKLEDAMKNNFPNTDLKGNPHINSKVCSWKKSYYSLTGILNRSGVGFNVNGSHLIDCEDDQWEQIVKIDNNARLMRYKSWPYYDDWIVIFGKDRANGERAEDILDAANEVNESDNLGEGHTGGDYNVSFEEVPEEVPENDETGDSMFHYGP